MEARYVLDTKGDAPRLTPVESSAVAAVGYDAASRTLWVRFREGGLYAYADLPPRVHAAFLQAPSKGRFFHSQIDGAYAYARAAP